MEVQERGSRIAVSDGRQVQDLFAEAIEYITEPCVGEFIDDDVGQVVPDGDAGGSCVSDILYPAQWVWVILQQRPRSKDCPSPIYEKLLHGHSDNAIHRISHSRLCIECRHKLLNILFVIGMQEVSSAE